MSDSDDTPSLSRVERLRVASAVAPSLRSTDTVTKKRRVVIVDAEGNPKRETTLAEVQAQVLAREHIELDTQEGVRPLKVVCDVCGKLLLVPKRGNIPKRCEAHRFCVCGKRLHKSTWQPAFVIRRGGADIQPQCVRCASINRQRSKTEEARREAAAKWVKKLTPEKRQERGERARNSMSKEQRSEAAKKGAAAGAANRRAFWSTASPEKVEQRREHWREAREKGHAANASLTPEQRTMNARKAQAAAEASLTSEQREQRAVRAARLQGSQKMTQEALRARGRKSAATRRARREDCGTTAKT